MISADDRELVEIFRGMSDDEILAAFSDDDLREMAKLEILYDQYNESSADRSQLIKEEFPIASSIFPNIAERQVEASMNPDQYTSFSRAGVADASMFIPRVVAGAAGGFGQAVGDAIRGHNPITGFTEGFKESFDPNTGNFVERAFKSPLTMPAIATGGAAPALSGALPVGLNTLARTGIVGALEGGLNVGAGYALEPEYGGTDAALDVGLSAGLPVAGRLLKDGVGSLARRNIAKRMTNIPGDQKRVADMLMTSAEGRVFPTVSGIQTDLQGQAGQVASDFVKPKYPTNPLEFQATITQGIDRAEEILRTNISAPTNNFVDPMGIIEAKTRLGNLNKLRGELQTVDRLTSPEVPTFQDPTTTARWQYLDQVAQEGLSTSPEFREALSEGVTDHIYRRFAERYPRHFSDDNLYQGLKRAVADETLPPLEVYDLAHAMTDAFMTSGNMDRLASIQQASDLAPKLLTPSIAPSAAWPIVRKVSKGITNPLTYSTTGRLLGTGLEHSSTPLWQLRQEEDQEGTLPLSYLR